MLRSDRISLGLPIAYLFSLLLIHVPGALVYSVSDRFLPSRDETEIGIGFTAIGSTFFVIGVWMSRFLNPTLPIYRASNRHQFLLFCVIGGWFFNYGVNFLFRDIASFGAVVDKGGAIWMLGVMLGLRIALQRGDVEIDGDLVLCADGLSFSNAFVGRLSELSIRCRHYLFVFTYRFNS